MTKICERCSEDILCVFFPDNFQLLVDVPIHNVYFNGISVNWYSCKLSDCPFWGTLLFSSLWESFWMKFFIILFFVSISVFRKWTTFSRFAFMLLSTSVWCSFWLYRFVFCLMSLWTFLVSTTFPASSPKLTIKTLEQGVKYVQS